MSPIDKLKKVIKGRTCFVVAKGKSIEELERRVEEYKDDDICWVTLNDFNYIEDGILSKIGKNFDIVSDCATVEKIDEYEPTIRIPRFEKYLARNEKNILAISELVVTECFDRFQREDLMISYEPKILTIDSLFKMPQCPKEVWDAPPNSITLLFAFLVAGGAKKIVVFGLDGCPKGMDPFESYYKKEIVIAERDVGFTINKRTGSLASDASDFNKKFENIFALYKRAFDNPNVDIVSCTPKTEITSIRRIDYNQVRGEL